VNIADDSSPGVVAGVGPFEASTARWDHLEWAATVIRIENLADGGHGVQAIVGEKHLHKFDLFDANPMLAGG
jgi:hypothetical protein